MEGGGGQRTWGETTKEGDGSNSAPPVARLREREGDRSQGISAKSLSIRERST